MDDHPYFGAVVGRVANRIKHGKYAFDDVEYVIETTEINTRYTEVEG